MLLDQLCFLEVQLCGSGLLVTVLLENEAAAVGSAVCCLVVQLLLHIHGHASPT